MRPAELRRVEEAEYLATEDRSPEKREWLDGHVYAMASGSPEHNLVCANLTAALARPDPATVRRADERRAR